MMTACSKPSGAPLVDAIIGQPLPPKYSGQGNNMGAFTFTTVPVANPELSAQLQEVNLFTDSSTGVLAGYRGDRTVEGEHSCRRAAELIDEILRTHYPSPFSGADPRYKYQSQDGKVVAGARCTKKGAMYALTLEVTNPELEEQLMSKARNER
jgi:hypothetical protein